MYRKLLLEWIRKYDAKFSWGVMPSEQYFLERFALWLDLRGVDAPTNSASGELPDEDFMIVAKGGWRTL